MTNVSHEYRLFPSVRFLIFILTLLVGSTLTSLNVTLGFAWVCMVNDTTALQFNNSQNFTQPTSAEGTLNWDKEIQGIIFSADSIGALILAIPGGRIIDRFGVKGWFRLDESIFKGLSIMRVQSSVQCVIENTCI